MKLFCEKPESKGYFISKNSFKLSKFANQQSKELLYRIQLLDKLQPNQFPSHFEIQFEVLLWHTMSYTQDYGNKNNSVFLQKQLIIGTNINVMTFYKITITLMARFVAWLRINIT